MGNPNLVPLSNPNDPLSVARAIRKLSSLALGPDSSLTFASVTLSGITASRILSANSSGAITSVDSLTDWIEGTTNRVTVSDDSDGTVTLSAPQDIHAGASPTFADMTLSAPVNIYALSHDSFADFVENEHIDWTEATEDLLTTGKGTVNGLVPGTDDTYDLGTGGTAPAGYELEDYQDTYNTGCGNITNTSWTGNTFTPSSNYPLGKVVFKLWRSGTPLTATLHVRATSDGKPWGADLASKSVDVSGITTNSAGELVEFILDTPIELSSGTMYSIVLEGDSNGVTYVRYGNQSGYAAGTLVYSTNSGSTWSINANYDTVFYCYAAGGGYEPACYWKDLYLSGSLNDGTDSLTITNLQSAYDHIHNLTTDIDHNELLNTHNLTTDIDHDLITNTHNLTTDIDHDQLTNTHNLTTDIDHNALLNYSADEHFLQTAITNVSTTLDTGLLKVTTGTGALSVITDNSVNWNTAYGWGNHGDAGYLTSVTVHDLLSATHGDTSAAAVVRGDIITGQGATPLWTRLAAGAAHTVLKSDGTDPSWGELDLWELGDTNIEVEPDGQFLRYDATTDLWINCTLASFTDEIDHDALLNYDSDEHIDWTNAAQDLLTSGKITASGNIETTAGHLRCGVEDTTRGYLYLYGGATGYGGSIYLRTPADSDGTIGEYMLLVQDDDFSIRDDHNGEIFKITGTAGNVSVLTNLDVSGTLDCGNATVDGTLTVDSPGTAANVLFVNRSTGAGQIFRIREDAAGGGIMSFSDETAEAIGFNSRGSSWIKKTLSLGENVADAKLTSNQESSTGAMPALRLVQADVDYAFLDYEGTSEAGASKNLSTWTAGNSIQGFTKIKINGTDRWMPYYDAPTAEE
jgi:hypothetical protein